jgi:hypothetical protein
VVRVGGDPDGREFGVDRRAACPCVLLALEDGERRSLAEDEAVSGRVVRAGGGLGRAIASAPDAQADTGVWTPARAPTSMLIAAAGPFGMSMGTVSGKTRRAPFSLRVS